MSIKQFKNKQIFCFMGLPLSGKSYMCKLLAQRVHNATYISTGDIARSLIKTEAEQKEMEAKDLFPGENALRAELKNQIEASTATCILIDGFPRFPDQALYLASELSLYFPTVVDVTAADMSTLATRAKLRARDSRDSNQVEFVTRLALAMKNQNNIISVLCARLVPHHTIVSTADDASILKQFQHITKQRP